MKICKTCNLEPVWNPHANNIATRCLSCKTKKEFQGGNKTRELVRKRDNHICADCGKVWVYGTRRFDVHHLGGVCGKKSRDYDKVATLEKLITICHKCHMNLEEVRYKMKNKLGGYKFKD